MRLCQNHHFDCENSHFDLDAGTLILVEVHTVVSKPATQKLQYNLIDLHQHDDIFFQLLVIYVYHDVYHDGPQYHVNQMHEDNVHKWSLEGSVAKRHRAHFHININNTHHHIIALCTSWHYLIITLLYYEHHDITSLSQYLTYCVCTQPTLMHHDIITLLGHRLFDAYTCNINASCHHPIIGISFIGGVHVQH